MKCFIVVLSLVALAQSRVVDISIGRTNGYPYSTTVGRRVTIAGIGDQADPITQVNRYSVPLVNQYGQPYGQSSIQTLVQQLQGPLDVSHQIGYGTGVPQSQVGIVQQVLEGQLQQQYGFGQLYGQSPIQVLVQQVLAQNAVGQQSTGLSGQVSGVPQQVNIPQTSLVQLVEQILVQNGVQGELLQQVVQNIVESGVLAQLVNTLENSQVGQQTQQVPALVQDVFGQQIGQTTPTWNQVVVNRPVVGPQGTVYPVSYVVGQNSGVSGGYQVVGQRGVQRALQQIWGQEVGQTTPLIVVNHPSVGSQVYDVVGQKSGVSGGYPVVGQSGVQAVLQQILRQQVGQVTPYWNQVIVNRPTVGPQEIL